MKLYLHVFYPSQSYSLLPRKVLEKQHLVFPDLEFSKKQEHIIVSRLSSRLSLPHVYQTPSNKQNNERHLIRDSKLLLITNLIAYSPLSFDP